MTAAPGLLERVASGGLLAPGEPVVVLLSGGRDSVCVADLAASISGPATVRALHVDYGLRATSGEEAAACGRLCERLGIGFELITATPPAAGAAGNLQAWARDLQIGRAHV